MNQDSENPTIDGEAPSFEPWLRVCALACVPMGAAMFLPGKFTMPLMGATVVLFCVAVVMLVRQERRKRP